MNLDISAGNYVELDCAITHEGRTFESGGAYLGGDRLVGYLGNGGEFTNWHGDVLGTYRITSSWRIPNSWQSDSMKQVEVDLDNGVVFTGRSMGVGMLFRGKRKYVRTGRRIA